MNFYVVATPIGNLEDITLRALRILKEVDYILTEDTRVSKKLLDYYKIKNKLISFHHHSKDKKYQEILSLLKAGKNLALISDAGTPNISDPGGMLVSYIRKNLEEVNIEVIPGPSALISALAISGLKVDKFTFMGFLPHKKSRQKFLQEIANSPHPVALFESKHRIIKLLNELNLLEGNKKIMIFRELTKMYYTFYNDSAENILKKVKDNNESMKGEFTLIIY